MADKSDRYPENVPGKYYVDGNCLYCETCIELAPDNFTSDNDEYAYVLKQPDNDSEEVRCQEALDSCPTDAIGDDGE